MIKSVLWPLAERRKDGPYNLNAIHNGLKALGEPNLKIPFPIHIVGTNGKGSTTAFLKAILKAAGFTSHVYTSPNLVCLNERITLAGEMISDSALTSLLEETKEKLGTFANDLSFFEGFTAAAFLAYSQTKADFCLIEAGLGGRYDATNVMESKICILTSVSYDHTEILGDSLEGIALEKLEVAKEIRPTVVSYQPYAEVYKTAEGVLENGSIYGRDYSIQELEEGFLFKGKVFEMEVKELSLIGRHQMYNAASAIAACEILNEKYGYNITLANIIDGLKSAVWPARFQALKVKDATHLQVFLDGALNEDGIRNILEEIERTNSKYEKTYIIFACLKRKDLTKIMPHFKGVKIDGIYLTSIHSSESSRTAHELAEVFAENRIEIEGAYEYFYEALAEIKNKARVIIFGSLYLAGEVLEFYANEK